MAKGLVQNSNAEDLTGLLIKQSTAYGKLANSAVDLLERAEAAESKLRAVSEALKEKLESWSAMGFAEYFDVYTKADVDARDARLRSIVDGK